MQHSCQCSEMMLKFTKVLKYLEIWDLHLRAPSIRRNGAGSTWCCSTQFISTWPCSSTQGARCAGGTHPVQSAQSWGCLRGASAGVQGCISWRGGDVWREVDLSTIYGPLFWHLPSLKSHKTPQSWVPRALLPAWWCLFSS